MPTLRHLLRAALRLHDHYRGRAGQAAEQAFLGRVADWQPHTRRVCALLCQAATAGRLGAALPLRRQLHRLVRSARDAAIATQHDLEQTPGTVPAVRDLLADLRQLEDEFGELHLDLRQKMLSVTTEPVELEEVHLGPFAIRLAFDRLARDLSAGSFAVVALDPNPAVANRDVTHPHVRDGTLCAGDAEVPIRRALEQGRLADAFCLVRGVLLTYNPASPHVALDEWGGDACYDCGAGAHADDLSNCAACGHDYCQDCIRSCDGCGDSRCGECLGRCPVCDESFCSGCLRPSAHSGRACCADCLVACAACGAAVATDEIDSPTRSCPSCTPAEAAASPAVAGVAVPEPSPTETTHEAVPLAAAAP